MSIVLNDIKNSLAIFMSYQGGFAKEFPGVPFVHFEKEFGLTTGPQNGGLHAIHHLIKGLELNHFFDGKRHEGTDLDTMMYTLRLGDTVEVYDGVTVSRSELGMRLVIKTKRSSDELLETLDIAIEHAQEKRHQRALESQRYADNIRSEFSKETSIPVFEPDTDIEFVKSYLCEKAAQHFSKDPKTHVKGPLPSSGMLSNIFAQYGVRDDRPRFEVSMEHTENDFSLYNKFHMSVLGKVFTGPDAVDTDIDTGKKTALSVEINGTPARLVKDIIKNDRVLARSVAKKMGLKLPK